MLRQSIRSDRIRLKWFLWNIRELTNHQKVMSSRAIEKATWGRGPREAEAWWTAALDEVERQSREGGDRLSDSKLQFLGGRQIVYLPAPSKGHGGGDEWVLMTRMYRNEMRSQVERMSQIQRVFMAIDL